MSARDQVQQRIRGLYGIADADSGDPERLGAAMLAGGCRLIQLRAKHWSPDEIERVGRKLARRCREQGATFILNDDAALAVASEADGVHVGQTDGGLGEIRDILGPDRILGRSTHSPGQALEALAGADYLAFGPVFETTNLSRHKPVRGLQMLKAVAEVIDRQAPLVAIGGISAPRLGSVVEAGAVSWAVIGAIAGSADPEEAVRALTR